MTSRSGKFPFRSISCAANPAEPPDDATLQGALALLLDVGTSLATELKAPAPDVTVVDRARAFEGVARAVRQTVLLSRHLAERRPTVEETRAQARRRVLRDVEDVIDTVEDPGIAETLHRELLERMERPELDHDLLTRKPALVIGEILRDLGLPAPGIPTGRRTPADFARLCARAAAPTAGDDRRTFLLAALHAGPAAGRLAEN